jgi:hypothetical protein
LGECANLNVGLADRWRIYDRYMRDAAARYDLDPALVAAVAFVESKWQHAVISKAGAEGLFQTMPPTGKMLAGKIGIPYQPYDPASSATMGALYLRMLINKWGYRLDWVLASYNAGSGAVKKYQGVPPYKETIAFVAAVKKALAAAMQAERRCTTGSGTVPQWGKARYGFGGSGSYPAPRPAPSSSPSSPPAFGSGAGLFGLAVLGVLILGASGRRER